MCSIGGNGGSSGGGNGGESAKGLKRKASELLQNSSDLSTKHEAIIEDMVMMYPDLTEDDIRAACRGCGSDHHAAFNKVIDLASRTIPDVEQTGATVTVFDGEAQKETVNKLREVLPECSTDVLTLLLQKSSGDFEDAKAAGLLRRADSEAYQKWGHPDHDDNDDKKAPVDLNVPALYDSYHFVDIEMNGDKVKSQYTVLGAAPYYHICVRPYSENAVGVMTNPLCLSFPSSEPVSALCEYLSRVVLASPANITLVASGRNLEHDKTFHGNGVPEQEVQLKCNSDGEFKQLFVAISVRYTLPEDHYVGEEPHAVECPQCKKQWRTKGNMQQDLKCSSCNYSWNRYLEQAMKSIGVACPNPKCGEMMTHYHGHGCHHISPYKNHRTKKEPGGCLFCGQNFCCVCRKPHGTPEKFQFHEACRHKQTYCRKDELLINLKKKPFPYDQRCGCVLCPDCEPQKPCAQCHGDCVVCSGLCPPGILKLRGMLLGNL